MRDLSQLFSEETRCCGRERPTLRQTPHSAWVINRGYSWSCKTRSDNGNKTQFVELQELGRLIFFEIARVCRACLMYRLYRRLPIIPPPHEIGLRNHHQQSERKDIVTDVQTPIPNSVSLRSNKHLPLEETRRSRSFRGCSAPRTARCCNTYSSAEADRPEKAPHPVDWSSLRCTVSQNDLSFTIDNSVTSTTYL